MTIAALHVAAEALMAQPDGRRVRLSVDTFHISRVVDGKWAAPDTLIQALTSVRWNGQPALLQVYRQKDFSGAPLLDSLWMDPHTLEPIRHSRRASQIAADLRFANGRITGRVSWPNGATQAVDTVVTGPIYDAGASDLIARALPMRAGAISTLTLYVPGFGPNPMRIVVTRQDTLRMRNGDTRGAWLLRGDIGGEPVTMWVAADNRDLLELIAGDPAAPSMRYTRH